jgi:DNA-binding MarR family transcriptional regulator
MPHVNAASAAPALSDALLDEFDASMLMLGRLMMSRHADVCEGIPVTGPRFLVLRLLGDRDFKVGDLASLLGVKAPAMSSIIEGLEREGLVTREHSAEDRRVVLVALTESGRAVLAEAEGVRRAHMRRYLDALTADDVRALIRIQRTLIDTIVAMES